MTKDFDIDFVIDGKKVGGSCLTVMDGKLITEVAEDEFYAVLRKNEKSLIKEAEEEERDQIIQNLSSSEEEKLKEEHGRQYIGTDDDMPDDYEDWLSNLSLPELKEIIN